jgi:hypothetical protein
MTTLFDPPRAVEALMQGIATDYPHLLEHSRLASANGRHQHG